MFNVQTERTGRGEQLTLSPGRMGPRVSAHSSLEVEKRESVRESAESRSEQEEH